MHDILYTGTDKSSADNEKMFISVLIIIAVNLSTYINNIMSRQIPFNKHALKDWGSIKYYLILTGI